jgi:radical SAM protein with 4Fe4S-binding SPASM domain
LTQLVSLSARYSPRVTVCILGALPNPLALPPTELAQARQLVADLERERFPARLAELWEGQPFASWRRPATRHGFCAACPHGERCEGGCASLAVTYSGRRGDNPMCLYRIERV